MSSGWFARAVPMDCRGRLISRTAEGIKTERRVRQTDEIFRGHYPHFAIVPGIYLIESALQAVEQFAVSFGFSAARMTILKSVRLLAPVRPDDQLVCEAKLVGDFTQAASTWDVVCLANETPVAKIKLVAEAL